MTTTTQFKDLVQSELARIESIVFDRTMPAITDARYYRTNVRQASILKRQRSHTSFLWPVMRLISLL